jgi:hypothetical protein
MKPRRGKKKNLAAAGDVVGWPVPTCRAYTPPPAQVPGNGVP